MKSLLLTCAALICSGALMAQKAPQLRADNIEEVLKAMTLEEKANLVVGVGMGGFSDKPVIGSTASIVPGAAGTIIIMLHTFQSVLRCRVRGICNLFSK